MNESEEIVHPLKGVNARARQFLVPTAETECAEYLLKIAGQTCRQSKGSNGKITKCTCLGFLLDENCAAELKGCAKYMVRFAKMRADDQKEQLRE